VHHGKARQAFERDVFPIVGRSPVADITPAIAAYVITKILDCGVADTASK
jgi:Phage integrase central domain